MNKLHLFTLLVILLESSKEIYSARINHLNQKSPASVVYTDGPAPEELKAGPPNKSNSDRKSSTKTVLQRYYLTTGTPTTSTIYESSTMTPNLKSSVNDAFIAERLNSSDFNETYNDSASSERHIDGNSKIHFTNSHFERLLDNESSKIQECQGTTNVLENQKGVFLPDNSFSIHFDTTSPSITSSTSTINPYYNDTTLITGVHSTSFLNKDLNSSKNTNFGIYQNSYPYNIHDINKNFDDNIHAHTFILPEHSVSTSIIESGDLSSISDNFKQTHHIVNHQPVSNNETTFNNMLKQLSYGDRTRGLDHPGISSNLPEFDYRQKPTIFPVYHPQPAIQHIPAITEIPVEEVQEHHGFVQKTFNIPQHGIQTKTYQIRRPAIQKQFYDIQEHVTIKPAGSVVIEIDQPIFNTPPDHISSVITNRDHNIYVPSPHPQLVGHYENRHYNSEHVNHHNAYLPNGGYSHNNGGYISYLPEVPRQSISHGHNKNNQNGNHKDHLQQVTSQFNSHESGNNDPNSGFKDYLVQSTPQIVSYTDNAHVNRDKNGDLNNYLVQTQPQSMTYISGGALHRDDKNDGLNGYLVQELPEPTIQSNNHSNDNDNGGYIDSLNNYLLPPVYKKYVPQAPPQPVPHSSDYTTQNDNQNDLQKPSQHNLHNSGNGDRNGDLSDNLVHTLSQPILYTSDGLYNSNVSVHNNDLSDYREQLLSQFINRSNSGHDVHYEKNHHSNYIQSNGNVIYSKDEPLKTHTDSYNCNNQYFLNALYQANNVPQYSVPIGSAVTTTQTSGNFEEIPIVVNVKHSEKYVDSLRKHSPNHGYTTKTLETLNHMQNEKQVLLEHQSQPPIMIAKGEPNFAAPPFVKISSNKEPFTSQKNGNQNYATNALYTMHSIINNNLYDAEEKENASVKAGFKQTEQEKVIPQSVQIAHVLKTSDDRKGTSLTFVKPVTMSSSTENIGIENVQYPLEPNNIEVFNSPNFKEEHNYKLINNSTSKNGFNSHEPDVRNQAGEYNFQIHSQNKQNPIQSNNIEAQFSTQNYDKEISSQNIIYPISQNAIFSKSSGVTYETETDQNKIQFYQNQIQSDPIRTSNLQPTQNKSNYEFSSNQSTPNVIYSQVPAVTYHIRADEISNIQSKNLQNSPLFSMGGISNLHDFTKTNDLRPTENYQTQNINYPQVSISGSSSHNYDKGEETITRNSINKPSAQFVTDDITFSTSILPNTILTQRNPSDIRTPHKENLQTISQSNNFKIDNSYSFERKDSLHRSQTPLNDSQDILVYTQIPAESRHSKDKQMSHHSSLIPISDNINEPHKGHLSAPYQNAQFPIHHQSKPCNSENPSLVILEQQFVPPYSTDLNNVNAVKLQHTNNNNGINPMQTFQNSKKESNAQFINEVDLQKQLSTLPEHAQKLVIDYMQSHQNIGKTNNQLHNDSQDQPLAKLKQIQIDGVPPNLNVQHFDSQDQPLAKLKQIQIYGVPPHLNVQHFPPNNILHSDKLNFVGTFHVPQKSYQPDNNTNNSILYQNNLITVQENNHDESDTLELKKYKQLEPTQVVTDNKHNVNENMSSFIDGTHGKRSKSDKHKTHLPIQDSVTSPKHSYLHIANNINSGDSSISFHPLPSQSQSHILEYLLNNKGHSARPVLSSNYLPENNFGFNPLKGKVVSATPASKYAKAAGEKINTRKIVVNQPIETIEVVEEQEPITTYKQITVQQPTIYKTQTVGVNKIATSVPQTAIYSEIPFYNGNHGNSHLYSGHKHQIVLPVHDNYHAVNAQINLHDSKNGHIAN